MTAGPPAIDRRPLGATGIQIAPVALGCWPIAGVTTLGANEADSLATVRRALDLGVNHLDTAYVYGAEGESERIVGRAIQGRREDAVIATKTGVHFEGDKMQQDARPQTVRAECEESLRRLGTDRVELLYLHRPDPAVPIEETAGEISRLCHEGKATAAGISNCTFEQLQAFHKVCPVAAVQLPYNLLQRGIEEQTLPWAQEHGVSVMTYWPLMKGLLAGRLPRDGQLDPHDKRLTYPMYQGDERQKNQALVDRLTEVAADASRTTAQLAVNWTVHRPGVTAALCGAKRPWQIEETAGAMGWRLSDSQLAEIEAALAERGPAEYERPFT